MEEKVFKTHDEQLEILRNRNIDFSSRKEKTKAKIIIQREGYYKLINGYKDLFLDKTVTDVNNEIYKTGTTVSQIFALYAFDRNIREIFLRHVLHIETNIKSLISYTISEQYGHDNYLLYKNFNTAKKNSNKEISNVIADLNQTISKNYSDPCIAHYLKNYGYVPMWVLNNVLTLGSVSRLYSVMKTPDRQKISKTFDITDTDMENFLFILSIIRNFCAHGNRLFCFRIRRPLVDTNIHCNLSIPKKNSEYIFGKRDLFSAVIALRYLLSYRDYKFFHNQLKGAINKLSHKISVIDINTVLQEMGFPPNWKELLHRNIKSSS